tara:strand:- start:56 stop:202 length:147 start_codon:yes stop_codon:yes gene_type:complete
LLAIQEIAYRIAVVIEIDFDSNSVYFFRNGLSTLFSQAKMKEFFFEEI